MVGPLLQLVRERLKAPIARAPAAIEVSDGSERRFAVNGNFHFMPLGTHAIRNDLTDRRIIIDDEYASDCHDAAIIQNRT